jgi:uncharacterized membrane protein HdeD (DUF308 family)
MTSPNLEELREQVTAAIYVYWRFFLAEGILMLLLGLLAVGLPGVSTFAVEILVGWLFLIGGILRIILACASCRRPGFSWSLVSPVCALLVGLWLLIRPVEGVLAATLLVALFFVVDGLVKLLLARELRTHLKHWGWTLASGVADLVLAAVIWLDWPGSAGWAIGLLVGINMCLVGVALLMTGLQARAGGLGPGL